MRKLLSLFLLFAAATKKYNSPYMGLQTVAAGDDGPREPVHLSV